MLAQSAINTLFNLVLLVGIPLLVYVLYHRRKGRGLGETLRRAGLQIGDPRYAGYCLAAAAVVAAGFALWAPDLEVGPWLLHGLVNLGVTLTVILRTGG